VSLPARADDVSLVVVVVDTNPFFWAAAALPFADFFANVRNPNSPPLPPLSQLPRSIFDDDIFF